MVADRILDGFGRFITIDNFDATMGAAVDERVERALAPFGAMLSELENKVGYIDLDGAVITTLIGNQTWTKPTGFNRFHVICIGAGAGGATGHYDALWGQHYGAKGGGGGGCSEETFTDAEVPATVACTVGVPGAGAVNGGGGAKNGADGTGSSFGSLLSAGGGKGDGTGGTGHYPGGNGGPAQTAGGAATMGTSLGGSGAGGGGGQNGFASADKRAGAGGRSGTLAGGTPAVFDTGASQSAGGPGVAPGASKFYGGSGGGGGGGRGKGGNGAAPGAGGGGGGIDGTGGNGGRGVIYIIAFYE